MRYLFAHLSGAPHRNVLGVVSELIVLAAVGYLITLVIKALRSRYPKSFSASFRPFSADLSGDSIVVVDCTHPYLATFSHHKGNKNPVGLEQSDTSTGLVLNAICASSFRCSAEVAKVRRCQEVTSNHFDIDSFLSVWAFLNQGLASQYRGVLFHMARIGDFREAFLCPELVSVWGSEDGISNIRDAYTSMKLCCWLNTMERKLFSRPYEDQDHVEKFSYFLPRFAKVLQDPESEWTNWQEEYSKVVGGFDAILAVPGSVERHRNVGLAVVFAAEPLHYYSLFSHTIGCDVVLSVFEGQRYEVECKYTQFVHVYSRPVWPRLDLQPLARALNRMELDTSSQCWTACAYTDSGPLLRLAKNNEHLTKAQRYGHPCDRVVHPSSIPAATMASVVRSYLEYGLRDIKPKRGGWTWNELHALNSSLDWNPWVMTCSDQHIRGELGVGATLELTTPPPSEPEELLNVTFQDPSHLLVEQHLRTIIGLLPSRYKMGRWRLLYSTAVHGISLSTLFRRTAKCAPNVLLVRDTGGSIFGAVCVDAWRIAPRFYGTGETGVFQLEPVRRAYPWRGQQQGAAQQQELDGFFQFGNELGLGVGGEGNWAIYLDSELARGSSNQCLTFSSPCLASSPEFNIHTVEIWQIV